MNAIVIMPHIFLFHSSLTSFPQFLKQVSAGMLLVGKINANTQFFNGGGVRGCEV